MKLVSRARQFYRRVKVPPDGVEKASLHDRTRRTVWVLLSTVIAYSAGLGILWAVLALLYIMGMPKPAGLGAAIAILSIWVSLSAYLDFKLFAWGLHRFNIVLPWQFRVNGVDVEEADV